MPTQPSPSIENRFSVDVAKIAEEVYRGEASGVLEALTQPVRTYYIRCNTLKITPNELLSRLEEKGLKVNQHPTVPEAIGIRVDGPFEIPSMDSGIVVDKHTAESVLQGANVYAPGILNCDNVKVGDGVAVVSELGDTLATGHATMSANDILTFRKGLAVNVDRRRFISPQVRELPEFAEGLFYPQSLAAIVTGRVLDPQDGEVVVDMNCAPGGKLSHLSQLMHNSGKVLGLDRNSQKVTEARKTLKRLGCTNTTVSVQDTRYVNIDYPELRADRVLVDPPCSALGLRPKIYDSTTMKRVNNLADYQRQFIKAGSKLLKPGGIMVYSVCTFTTQECERVTEFAQGECGLSSVEQIPFIAKKSLPGEYYQKFHPIFDEIGYFIAKFKR
jgi:predicted RNA-binding protein (TIGR00451 family)